MARSRLFYRALITCYWSLNTLTAQTHATRLHSQPLCLQIPTEQLSTVSTMARVFLPRTDHMVLQNILICICFALISMNANARCFRRVKYVTL